MVRKPAEDRLPTTGFTLIEILVVTAIIALLAVVALVSMGISRAEARDARRIADVSQVRKALELRFDKEEQYPKSPKTGPPGWADSCSDPAEWVPHLVQQKYLGFLPIDPVNSGQMCYRYRGEGQNFKLAVFMETQENRYKYSLADGGVYDDWYELFTPAAQNWAW